MTVKKCSVCMWVLLIPNRTFLVRVGSISGEFGRAMVRILARRSRDKIPMARPNEPDMQPKRAKKVRLGIYRTQIHQKTGYIHRSVEAMLARYVLQIVLTWSSILLPSSSSAFFSTRLFRVSFSKFSKSKLSEKFGNSELVGKYRAIGERAQV